MLNLRNASKLGGCPAYLRNVLVVRSLSGLPPVWHVGQYCSADYE